MHLQSEDDDMPIEIKDIPELALGIGIAIVIVAITSLVIVSMVPSSYMTMTYANWTFTHPTNVTQVPVSGIGAALYSVTVYNDTTQLWSRPETTNWTLNTSNYTLQLLDTSLMNTPMKSISFRYLAYTNSTKILEKGADAFMDFADWFAILVVVIVSVLILALVMMLRNRGGQA